MKRLLVIFPLLISLSGCAKTNQESTSSFSSENISSEVSSNNTSSEISSYISSSEYSSEVVTSSEILSSSEEIISDISSENSSFDVSDDISSDNSTLESSSEETNYITATFVNYDGTILYINNTLVEGDYPYYEGEKPTKESDNKYDYYFVGWDKELDYIYEDTTYTAVFEKEDRYYQITELITFNGDYPTLYQQEVYLYDVVITSVYDDNTFFISSIHDPLDFYSIEVKSSTPIKGIFDRTDIINVTGTIDVINGRPFINNASVSWGTGGEDDCDDGAFISTVKLNDREEWNEKISKKDSGNMYYSYMTMATIPEIEVNKESSFYITFPGEDIEVTSRNPFLIEVRIPSLSGDEVEEVKTWASQFNKGDGIYINFQVYYDNYLMGLLTYDNISSRGYNTPYTHKNVFQTYQPVSDFLLEEYPSYITFPDMSHEDVYNYVTKTKYETIDNSTTKYLEITFYTYEIEEVISHLINMYSSLEDYTYIGIEDGKHFVTHPYSPNLDLHLCFYELEGKIVFETHIID